MSNTTITDEEWREAKGRQETPVIEEAKRCGVQWTPWMGDWFTSYSPRNDNNNAEGTWDHWIDLALYILADPLTKVVRPQVYEEKTRALGLYSESRRSLTDAELRERFDR